MLSERPGGDMLMILFVERSGENYPKAKTGAPILPLFRMSDRKIPASLPRQLPEFAEDAPVWRPAPDQPSFFTMPGFE